MRAQRSIDAYCTILPAQGKCLLPNSMQSWSRFAGNRPDRSGHQSRTRPVGNGLDRSEVFFCLSGVFYFPLRPRGPSFSLVGKECKRTWRNGTAAAVLKLATPQRVRRTLPELSRSRGFKQAGRFAFCPPGQKVPSRARSRCQPLPPGPIVTPAPLNGLQAPGETSRGLQSRSEEPSTSRPAAAGSAHLRRAREGIFPPERKNERTNCLSRREAVSFCAPRRTYQRDLKAYPRRRWSFAGSRGKTPWLLLLVHSLAEARE